MADKNDLFQFDDFSGTESLQNNNPPQDNDLAGDEASSIRETLESEMSVDFSEERNESSAQEDSSSKGQEESPSGGYDDDAIQHLDWNEHIRRRPGMYIGKLGDGSHAEDGIYVLIKEVVDNSIDEFNMGAGKRIDINIDIRAKIFLHLLHPFERLDCLIEHLAVQIIADRLHMAMLALAQQIAGAPDFQILHRNLEPAAQIRKLADCL